MELSHKFNEEVKAVAFHPSGFHIAVAFQNKVSMINILLNRLQPYRDFSESGVISLAYSHGGQYLAVSKPETISLYSVYTGNFLSQLTLRAHSSEICKIRWHPNDLGLFSLGKDGQLNEWELERPH